MRRPVVLIIIDALGADICSSRGFDPLSSTPFAILRTEFGFSQAALTSIMTGKNPREHGLWMMYSFAPENGPFRFIDSIPGMTDTERLWVRRAIGWKLDRIDKVSAYYNLYDVPGDVLPHLDLPARKSLFTTNSVPGSPNLIDEALSIGCPVFVRDHNDPENRAFKELAEVLTRNRPGFYLLYTAGLDAIMHTHGTTSAETAKKLDYYEKKIRELKKICPEATFTVMGDHGMCDVVRDVDVVEVVRETGLVRGIDYLPFYDSTMARFKLLNPEAETVLRKAFQGADYGEFLDHDEIRRLGIDFEGNIFGDLIFLMKQGSIILPSFMGKRPVAAMHGYHPDSSSMFSALYTDHPGGFSGEAITEVASFIKGLLSSKGEAS